MRTNARNSFRSLRPIELAPDHTPDICPSLNVEIGIYDFGFGKAPDCDYPIQCVMFTTKPIGNGVGLSLTVLLATTTEQFRSAIKPGTDFDERGAFVEDDESRGSELPQRQLSL